MKKVLTLFLLFSHIAFANLEEDVAKLFPPEQAHKVLAFIAQIPPGVFSEIQYVQPRDDDWLIISPQLIKALSMKVLQLTCIDRDQFKFHACDIWKFISELDFVDSFTFENMQIPDELPTIFSQHKPIKLVLFHNCKLGANAHQIQQRVTNDYIVTIEPGFLLQ